MSTLPSPEGEARVSPAKPVETPWDALASVDLGEPVEAIGWELYASQGNCCPSCGWWVAGGADPAVMATHRCDDGDEYDGGYHGEPTITDTQTGQGVV